jgi:WD40 repeat protein
MLLSNNEYDFRDVFVDEDETVYAVSRSGHLAIIEKGTPRVIAIQGLDNPMAITNLDDNSLLLMGDHGLAVYDKQRRMIVATRELDFHLTATSRYNNHPILFDDRGRQHIVMNINELTTSEVPVKGRVTSFASSKASKTQVFGMSDGTIYLLDETTQKLTKLEGHISRISKLKLNNQRLLSSSYDGTLVFWNTASAKIEPTTMLTDDSWIMNFNFDNSKQYAWVGDQNGNLTEALLSVPMMVDLLKKKLKRNFTQEEWDYYIGKNVPYETFVSESGKEVEL